MPATFTKPTTTPRWADDGTPGQIVVPMSTKQDLGWILNEEPPFSFFNWHQNLTGEWVKWLGERLDDGGDENTFIIRNPNNASAFIELDGPNETIDFDGTSSALVLDLSGTAPFFSSGLLGFGDENFQIDFNSGNPQITFSATAAMLFTRAGGSGGVGEYAITVNSVREFELDALGLKIDSGLVVGDVTTAPTDKDILVPLGGIAVGHSANPTADQVTVGDASFALDLNTAGEPKLFLDGGTDYISMRRSANTFDFVISSSTRMQIDTTGVRVGVGLHVGGLGVTPVADRVSVGVDSAFGLDQATTTRPRLQYDSTDFLEYDRSNNAFVFFIGGTAELIVGTNETKPDTTGVMRLGTSVRRFLEMHTEASIAYDKTTIAPSATSDLGRRVLNNTVTAAVAVQSDGTLQSGNSRWNVTDVTHTVTSGIYTINLTRALPTLGGIAVANAEADTRRAQVSGTGTTTFIVHVLDNSDVLADGDFKAMCVGGGAHT